jgi:glycine hydroxymethyltransferase
MSESLREKDPQVFGIVADEEAYQRDSIRLIASENYVSKAVLEASGSVFANKYSEGYAGSRYYQGQANVDALERLAIARAKELFGAEHANVQPYSGSPANLAAYLAFMKPGDAILGMKLSSGGHLTHGAKVSISGKHFRAVSYSVDPSSGLLDYDAIQALAEEHKPRVVVAGYTAYPRHFDFERFRRIADSVGAIFMVDMSHVAGLVAGKAHPDPVPWADVVTTTTHKTLRGPRGAMILCKAEHAAAVDKAVFPGVQGGPHNNTTAAIAVALGEALRPEFALYAARVVANAKALGLRLAELGFSLVSGGTDNHLLLVDLRGRGVTGKEAALALEKAGIVLNCNTVPGDSRKANDPSGIRLGSAAVTSRGFGEAEMGLVAEWIAEAISAWRDEAALSRIASRARELCLGFPAPGLD